jgi:hypothetical protein
VPGGTAHAESLTGNIPCVGNQVADYLTSGKPPKGLPGSRADATCKANVVRPG